MSPPPAKKQKLSQLTVVFKKPGLDLDTCFSIFGKDFLVNSIELKAHSSFFRAFFDQPVVKLEDDPIKVFQYEIFTLVSEDKSTWELTSEGKYRKKDLSKFTGNPLTEADNFERFLCSISGKSYQINNVDELRALANLATKYCACPVVSNSLWRTIYTSPGFFKMISDDPCSVLQCAYQLRHEELFRECFVHVLGPWSKPRWLGLSDPILRDLAAKAQDLMERRLYKIFTEIMNILVHKTYPRFHASVPVALNESGRLMMPKYLRDCYDEHRSIRIALDEVLASRLTLDLSRTRMRLGSELLGIIFCALQLRHCLGTRHKFETSLRVEVNDFVQAFEYFRFCSC